MAITWTDEYLDLNTATFTDHSAPTPVDDLWNPLAATLFDGIDDAKTSSEKPFLTATGTAHTAQIWIEAAATGNTVYMGQRNLSNSATQTFQISRSSTNLLIRFANGSAGSSTSSVASGVLSWDDGNLHLITATVNGNDVNVYIDGVEATSYVIQDSVSGGGFTGFPATTEPLSLGQFSNRPAGWFSADTIARAKFASGDAGSDAEVLAEYNAEVAAIGEGLSSGYTDQTLLTTLFS